MDSVTDWSGRYKGRSLVVGLHTPGKPTGTTIVRPHLRVKRVKGESCAAWQYRIKDEGGSTFEAVGIATRSSNGRPLLTVSEQRVLDAQGQPTNEFSSGILQATKMHGNRVTAIELLLTSSNFPPLVVQGHLERRKSS